MIVELGHYALILALLLSLVLGSVPMFGIYHSNSACMALARRATVGQALFMAVAWLCLILAFVQSDFSVRNVAENSNTLLPLQYRIAAAWGSHEGSMLLWLLMQSGWMLALACFSRDLPPEQITRVLAVMAWLAAGFILFVLSSSNPFLRLFPVPLEGRDLNPLLQDPAMVLHPPLLYMGYVGFSVAFAFAMAALLEERADPAWARWARPWTNLAWCFLTMGVGLGSWWAYYELGWGGWWFWDPVENAALMPWLLGTALIHALAVVDRRRVFQPWAVLLAILCFSLSLVGTFLVRSGVLSSVHAFAMDPRRGLFILGFLLLVIGGALALFSWRAVRLSSRRDFQALSRETLLLGNSVLLLVAAASVLLGTFYPLLMDVFGLGKLSVGAPYFEAVFAPLMAPAVFLMAVAPLARWGEAKLPDLWTQLRWALLISGLVGVGLPLYFSASWSSWVALGLFLSAWVALGSAILVLKKLRWGWPLMSAQPLSWWGMVAAHLGVAVFIVGVTLVKGYQTEIDLRVRPGDEFSVGGQVLRFEGVEPVRGPNYQADRGRFTLGTGERARFMAPEKRLYPSMPQTPLTESAIASSWDGDIYLTLGQPLDERTWTLRAYHKPFVAWIWAGCLLMALGGLLAASKPLGFET